MSEDYRLPGLPRYVRVNTLKIGRGAAEKNLKSTGHFFCPDPKHPGHRAFFRDKDVPDLLVFKPKGQSDISRVPMVASGEVVVQQKASCFPALALAPPAGCHAIDGCAAPGNKTSHLAALMQNRGRVFAFEMNPRRCELLREMMRVKNATIVETRHQSFLDADPKSTVFSEVTHILLDPSCSASGMSQTPTTDPADLKQLAEDQEALILHALSFPKLEALVYSTCSIHDAENEEVVKKVLKQVSSDFELVPALPWWGRRGHDLDGTEESQHIAKCCVRTSYPDDQTIGFFLARFERRKLREAAAAPTTSDTAALDAKLVALAKARAKAEKAAEGMGSQRKEEKRQQEVPAWRLERDAKKKKKRQRESGD